MGNTSSSSNSTNIFHPSTSQQQHQQHQNSDKMNSNNSRQLATFAAGCFWGVEKSFARKFKTFGIVSKVGYIGGKAGNPSYKQVCIYLLF